MSHIVSQQHHTSFANRNNNNIDPSRSNIPLSNPSSPSIDSTIASEDENRPNSHISPSSSALRKNKIPRMPNANRHHHNNHHQYTHGRHHQILSSSHHHNNHSHTYPSTAVHDPLPAACTSLLSLRSGHHASNKANNAHANRRPHNAARDGALPILTMALTLMEARSAAASASPTSAMHSPPTVLPVPAPISASRYAKHAHKPPPSHAAASGSRFWDTVLPPIPSPAAPSTARPSAASAEDESAKMNIPCVVCGVRFRKPGHLNMHWRSVHASSSDATYPGKLTMSPSVSVSKTQAPRITKHADTGRSSKAASNSSGIRPYGCPQCVSRFRRGSDRNRHMRMVHAKIRPFECTQCGSHFGRKSFLEAHISTVHEKQRPFRCECGAAFGQRSSLTRHARKIHGPPQEERERNYSNK